MSLKKRQRKAFRPTMNDQPLEERVVLSAAASANLVFTRQPVAPGAVNIRSFNTPQIAQAYKTQFRLARQTLRRAIRLEANQLLAGGTPTQQQIDDFNAGVQGAINATTLRLASQTALLPGASQRILPRLERALLGNSPRSLTSGLQSITGQDLNRFPRPDIVVRSGRASARAVANTPLNLDRFPQPNIVVRSLLRDVNRVLNTQATNVSNYVASGRAQSLSTNQFNQTIPLRRYMAGQALSQFGNTLASLSNGFQNVATTSLFNGTTTATPETMAAYLNQGTAALGTSLYQLGSALSLFPNANTTIFPQLQSAFFNDGTLQPFTTTTTIDGTGSLTGTGNGTGLTSPGFSNFLNAFQTLPMNSTAFGPAISSLFNTGYQTIAGNLGSYLGLPLGSNLALPTQASGIFGSLGSLYGNGFNTGFGSGVIGFGTPTNGFNTSFSTGFNNTIGLVNPGFGFNVPTSIFTPIGLGASASIDGTGSLTGTGTGIGLGGTSPIDGTGTLTGTGNGTGIQQF